MNINVLLKRRRIIVLLPLLIIGYSLTILIVLLSNNVSNISLSFIMNIFEFAIPVIIILMFAFQFSLYLKSLNRRKQEVIYLQNKLYEYQDKVKKMETYQKEIQHALKDQLNERDYNYSIVKLSFLIENELRRIAKKSDRNMNLNLNTRELFRQLSDKKVIPSDIIPIMNSFTDIRNRAVHGMEITKEENDKYTKIGELILFILRTNRNKKTSK